MKELKKYDIHIINLQIKEYAYEFLGENAFFEAIEQPFIKKGKFKALVSLEKSETMIQLRFDIKGTVELECDRSLDLFDYDFETVEKLILKFGESNEELSDEIVVIPRYTEDYNIAQTLFDFIYFALPTKKLHPRYQEQTEDDDTESEGKLIYSSNATQDESAQEKAIDPRWAALAKLKPE